MLILSFFIIQPFLKVILLAALLAYILFPFYKKLSLKLNKTVTAFLICLAVFLILIIPSIFFIKTLIQETYMIFIVIKQRLATGILSGCEHNLCETFKTLFQNPEVNYQIQNLSKSFTNWIVQKGSEVLVNIPNTIINLFIMFFALFYFLKDGEKFIKQIHHYVSIKKKKSLILVKRLEEIVHGVVFGYFIVALIQGALGTLGFFIFGISSPIFWGLMMALLALIPFLGTGIIWVPASLFLFLEGLIGDSNLLIFKGVALFVYGLIFVSTSDNILKPKLMGDKAKVHPAIVLLGIFGGLLFFGPLGVIFGPLILSLVVVIANNYLVEK